ncbi:hypothetical protein KUTeg_008659 [Tegillarca granosa]|uniref:Uncharacterized protein n=1 Tax=Tegillarca granosa TaxID=220873 RepID=A0ABQ9FEK8_TEGGR|nr:hypothetical protein KUTeg_008659 [Tegillarca granosa]
MSSKNSSTNFKKKGNQGTKRKKGHNLSLESENKRTQVNSNQDPGSIGNNTTHLFNISSNGYTNLVQNQQHSSPVPSVGMNFQNVPNQMLTYNVSPISGYIPNLQNSSNLVQSPVPGIQPGFIDYDKKLDIITMKMDDIFQKLDKLDKIEKKMCSFKNSIGNVIKDVGELKNRVVEVESELSFMNDQLESSLTRTKTLNSNIDIMKDAVRDLLQENSLIRKEIAEVKESNVELQARSMRDNLVFSGIPEQDSENTETVLMEIIAQKLEITEKMEFHRVHRMGRKFNSKNRPIVAKFVNFKDRENVRKAGFTKLKGENNRSFGINEQFPREINERRKKLYPYYKSARRQNKRAVLSYDKLYIDGKRFQLNEDEQLMQMDGPVDTRREPRSRNLSASAAEFKPSRNH